MRFLETISLAHLGRLTDHQGLLACAIDDIPDPYRGHRTLDNAEALRLLAGIAGEDDPGRRRKLVGRCFGFLRGARRDDRTFHHHRDATGHWRSPEDEETVNAHVAWSLAAVLSSGLADNVKTEAGDWLKALLDRLGSRHLEQPFLPGPEDADSPPPGSELIPSALWILALTAMPPDHPCSDTDLLPRLAANLAGSYDATQRATGWPWFAPRWTPGAARIATALWHAADALDDANLYRAARESTDFVIDHFFEDGLFLPVGTGGWQPGRDKAIFDQQAGEAATVTELLATAQRATGDTCYGQYAEYAFRWFHGNNIRGREMADPETGACRHAICTRGTDTNRHAAATLAYLNAHIHIHAQQCHARRAALTVTLI